MTGRAVDTMVIVEAGMTRVEVVVTGGAVETIVLVIGGMTVVLVIVEKTVSGGSCVVIT